MYFHLKKKKKKKKKEEEERVFEPSFTKKPTTQNHGHNCSLFTILRLQDLYVTIDTVLVKKRFITKVL